MFLPTSTGWLPCCCDSSSDPCSSPRAGRRSPARTGSVTSWNPSLSRSTCCRRSFPGSWPPGPNSWAGLGTRLIALPLAVTMFVAAWAVHLDNGWPAIAPSNPPEVCIAGSDAHAGSNVFERYIKCYNVNEQTLEASKRLARARSILREYGDYGYLNGSGSIVKLNSGIEFAAIYLAMLLALVVIGGGRYLSIDYYLGRLLAGRSGPQRE
ncbi:MAG: DoxX family protein [Gammaproteobacteria bacterium]|nr:MAG: DoxX family protein [Gammaproteobacteria bacterium]